MSDNATFDMTDVPVGPAMEIAFSVAPGRKATHWKVDRENNRLLLAWNESAGSDFVEFLTPMTAIEATAQMPKWLTLLDYGFEPDHDGHNKESFRVYTGHWGFVDQNQYVFCAVEPAWAMYGK